MEVEQEARAACNRRRAPWGEELGLGEKAEGISSQGWKEIGLRCHTAFLLPAQDASSTA